MIDYFFYYTGPLIFKIKISKEDLKSIQFLCKKDSSKDYRKSLAGHLKDEYLIDNKKIQIILNKYLESHKKAYEHFYNKAYPGKLTCNSSWVNYMKRGESNPVHIHKKCHFSSVIFLQIPEKLKEENKKHIGTSKGPGNISFQISAVSDFYVDSISFLPEIGDFYIFPWNLKHFVSPFKSKGERISVACNFNFEQ
jgi:hypothetical protein